MKKSVVGLLSIVLCSAVFLGSDLQAAHKPFSIASSPSVAQDLNNNAVHFPNKSGKWTILNYWAQWCGPCIREIPDLNAFYKKHQDKVILVGLNSDLLDHKTLQKMAKDLKIQFPLLQSDPLQLVDSLEGTPSTYLISPKGEVYGPLLGPQSERSLLKAIQNFS